MPRRIPEAIRKKGMVTIVKAARGCWRNTLAPPGATAALIRFKKKPPQRYNAVTLPRKQRAAAQVTPAERRVEVQADSCIVQLREKHSKERLKRVRRFQLCAKCHLTFAFLSPKVSEVFSRRPRQHRPIMAPRAQQAAARNGGDTWPSQNAKKKFSIIWSLSKRGTATR